MLLKTIAYTQTETETTVKEIENEKQQTKNNSRRLDLWISLAHKVYLT